METTKLTAQQSLSIADLPDSYRVVGVDRSALFVRKPTGQLMRIQRDGRLTVATSAAQRRLADRRSHQPTRQGVKATTPYTSLMD